MFKVLIPLTFAAVLTLGCSSAQKTEPAQQKLPEASVKGPVTLKLGAKKGNLETTRYRYNSISESFEEGAIRLRQEQGVEFVTKTETVQADDFKVLQFVATTEKNGDVDLHTMAMPELGERLEMGVTRTGEVLMAGNYPKQSIFYVPQISLPKDKVEIGDTWDMEATWVTLDDGIPFVTEMVSILKGFVKCGTDQCADIEMSGEVRLHNALPIAFKNEWTGRMLFAINAGVPVWSHMASRADYSAEAVQKVETSCLETILEEPVTLKSGMNPVCKSVVKPETPPPAKPAPESAAIQKPQTI